MNRKPLIAIVLAAAVAGGGWWLAHRPPAGDGALVLSGNVDVRQVDLSFRVEGRLAKLWWRKATASPPVR